MTPAISSHLREAGDGDHDPNGDVELLERPSVARARNKHIGRECFGDLAGRVLPPFV